PLGWSPSRGGISCRSTAGRIQPRESSHFSGVPRFPPLAVNGGRSRAFRSVRARALGSERMRELRRRRHRRKKMTHWKKRAAKATVSEKLVIAGKIRELTPGAEQVIAALGLEER